MWLDSTKPGRCKSSNSRWVKILLLVCLVNQVTGAPKTSISLSSIDTMRSTKLSPPTFMILIVILIGLAYTYETIPPVTIILMVMLLFCHGRFISEFDIPLSKICMDAALVLRKRESFRLISSTLFHGNDFHLAYCLVSFAMKAVVMEECFGSDHFMMMFFVLAILVNLLSIPVTYASVQYFGTKGVVSRCNVGISGINFAFHTISAILLGNKSMAYWVEFPILCFMMPKTTFIPNVSGILAGVVAMVIFDRVAKWHMSKPCTGNCRLTSCGRCVRIREKPASGRCRKSTTPCPDSCATAPASRRRVCPLCGHVGCSGGCRTNNTSCERKDAGCDNTDQGGIGSGILKSRKKWFWNGPYS